MADATSASPELVLAHLDSLPTLPAVALNLLKITAQENAGAADVVRLLRGDQSLTARVLAVAGSPAYGAREVTTLERAVPLIGFAGVRSVVLAVSVFDSFARQPVRAGAAFDRVEFWKHALAVACAARRLALLRPDLDLEPEAAFIGGLLHDLGKVALSTVFPKAYDRAAAEANQARADIADAERANLGADHTVAGRRLAERWRLARELQEVIWLHHLAPDALPGSVVRPRLIATVQLADTVAREQRIGYSGNYLFYDLSPRLAERIGFSAAHLAAVVASLATDVAEFAARLGLDGETPQAVYVKAMGRANAELGRLNAELLAGNRRLAGAARYFNAIMQFEERLADWADPAAVVVAMAHAASAALQRPRVAAFGLREGGEILDLCCLDSEDSPGAPRTQAVPTEFRDWLEEQNHAGEPHVLAAPAAVRALWGDVLNGHESGTPWLLAIRHRGALAGGVLYESPADEPVRLAGETQELRSFLASLGLALGRANAQAAARRLSEDLAVTNRRLQQVQVELLRSRTLSMIAEMAAGAGHELNSPLTVISGRAQMLAAQLDDPDAQRVLQVVSDKAHECSGIVSELMDFARPRPPQLAAVDLTALLEDVRAAWLAKAELPASRLRVVLPAGARAEGSRPVPEAAALDGAQPLFAQALRATARLAGPPAEIPGAAEDAAGGRPLVHGDAAQLRLVLDELVANAVEAISSNDGTITLRSQAGLQAGSVEVLVEDTGRGMTPAVLQRAFDPFFSHRPAGRSRGLGLPRTYRIVEAHGGRVWLESQPDQGTTAHVVLPRAPRVAR